MTSPTRGERVARAREAWVRRLIDLSRRNNLLYYRELKSGTLNLDGHDPATLASLMAGEAVHLSRLLPETLQEDHDANAKRLNDIRKRALANLEERGLSTLFLALGMATWNPSDDGRPPEAAVLLVPLEVEARGRDGRQLVVRRAGDIQVNLVLLHVLESAHGLVVTPDQLVEPSGGGGEGETFDPAPVFETLRGIAAEVPGFAVNERAVIGNFAFQKMAMVRDLQALGETMEAHDLIAALAGDGAARTSVLANRVAADPRALDSISPDDEFLIMDADSSQQLVVNAVAAGQSGVVQGPPGTGKSQVISNLIASLAAEGKRILFVAEKRAALEVVLRRLEVNGLGHLALDLHGADLSRRQVMARIAHALETVQDSAPVDAAELHRAFADRRARLNQHVARLHASRAPSGLSVFEIQGAILRLPAGTESITRWRGAELDRLTGDVRTAVRDLLIEAAGFGGLFSHDDPSPWAGAQLPTGTAAQVARDAAARLVTTDVAALRTAMDTLARETGLPQPTSVDDAAALAGLAEEASAFLETYRPELFARDLAADREALQPAKAGFFHRFFAGLWNGRYKSARKGVRGARTSGADPAALHDELGRALDLAGRWEARAPGTKPAATPSLAAAKDALATATAGLAPLIAALPARNLGSLPLDELSAFAGALVADSVTPARLPRLLEIESDISARGAGAIVGEIRHAHPAPSAWPSLFEHAYLWSCLEKARAEEPAVAGFNGRTHDAFVEEFRALDKQRLELAKGRVRRAHAERVIDVMNRYHDQEALIRREAQKRARHLPLRHLLARAPDLLTALSPCWMASPLSVSQLLDGSRRYFDVVVFDEASQVLPEDAVPSLLRATHAVVAGDQHQLPPTTFFAAGDDDEAAGPAEEDASAGFESLLDLMAGFLSPWTLDWHYRSRDESLIAFSNRHIYEGKMVTFPDSGGDHPLSHVHVQHRGDDADVDSVAAEVQRVVDLVLEHAAMRPKETLGVIAMGIVHAQRVEEAIEEALQSHPELDAFFDQSLDERFFVKNLERVQGDEREAIIITVGYGKDRSGRLLNRFGPLNQAGGERRLNVAVTRARRRLTLVSSFTHHDMDPSRFTARGVTLLRDYIAYVAGASGAGAQVGEGAQPPSLFEADVAETLAGHGMELVPRVGASEYRLDLVVRDPAEDSRFVLAIESDGATYAAANSARDRDRTRREQLERRGWTVHRVWSTDWFMRRAEEVDRVTRAFEAATAPPPQPAVSPAHSPVVAAPPAESELPEVPGRAPRPRGIGRRESIDDYRPRELDAILRWIRSDGRLRSDEQLLDEAIDALGFSRKGARIESALREAIARTASA